VILFVLSLLGKGSLPKLLETTCLHVGGDMLQVDPFEVGEGVPGEREVFTGTSRPQAAAAGRRSRPARLPPVCSLGDKYYFVEGCGVRPMISLPIYIPSMK